jgi:hypothetical protein
MRLVVTITIDIDEARVRSVYNCAEDDLAILRGEKEYPERLHMLARDAVLGSRNHGADLGVAHWEIKRS